MTVVDFRSPRNTGFTLLELVAVVAILGIAAGIVTLNFSSPLRKARTHSAAEIWMSIDQLARELSQKQNIELELIQTSRGLHVALRNEQDQIQREWLLRSPVRSDVIDSNGQELKELVFNRRSGTIDYRCTFRDAQFSKSLEFAGGTGYVRITK